MSNYPQNPFDSQAGGSNPYHALSYQSYSAPQAGYYKPHRGPIVLTLGVIGLVMTTLGLAVCALVPLVGLGLSIPAWVMASADLKAMNRGEMDPTGRGITIGGLVTESLAQCSAASWSS